MWVLHIYNIMIFDKIKNMSMCMCYMVQSGQILTVATIGNLYTQELQWNFYMHAKW